MVTSDLYRFVPLVNEISDEHLFKILECIGRINFSSSLIDKM